MFDSLSGKLQNAFKNLRGLGKISESNVSDSLREVRMALLDADVNFKVARDFIERVKEKAVGQQVIQSIQPGQQVIKVIHDELVELLGSQNASLELGGAPASVLMIGFIWPFVIGFSILGIIALQYLVWGWWFERIYRSGADEADAPLTREP